MLQDISIRPLRENDLATAEHIRRLAFGTWRRVPDPTTFGMDTDYIRTRWLANPSAGFGAEREGELVGSNLATDWGTVGFFGPLTVRPDLWAQGIGSRLMEPIMDVFARWGIRHAGLITFADSPGHLHLYQKFGFWPRFLTAIMSKPVTPPRHSESWLRYSRLPESEREQLGSEFRVVTDAICGGLNVDLEVRAVAAQKLGDTVVLLHDTSVAGFAVCHVGPGTEAGNGACYVKFGVMSPRTNAREFEHLLDACEALAAVEGMSRLVAGVNTARAEAYRAMLAHGFRTDFQGVAMHKPNEPGYNQSGIYLIDDWR